MTSPLDYAPPQKWHQRRRFRRVAIALIILAALALTALQFGPPIYRQCRMLYWQRQCMNHVEPPGMRPAIEELTPTIDIPPELVALKVFVPDPRLPHHPLLYPYSSGGPRMFNDSHAYLHSRRAPGGTRLVCAFFYEPPVPLLNGPIAASYDFISVRRRLSICVIEPGTFFSQPKVLSRGEFNLDDDQTRTIGDYRFDSDPADESVIRFTFIRNETSPPGKVTHTVRFRINAKDETEIADYPPYF